METNPKTTDIQHQDKIYQSTSLFLSLSQLSQKLQQTSNHPYFIKINYKYPQKLVNLDSLLTSARQIKPKMIIRVLTWLQKLSNQTMKFSTQTFEVSARMLMEYLLRVDESVANLQLIGCACLYLASKIGEPIIVAAQSYVECSVKIFTVNDLMCKQAKIYEILQANTNFTTLSKQIIKYFSIYDFIQQQHIISNSDEVDRKIKQVINMCLKDPEMLTFIPSQLIFNIFQLTFCMDEKLDLLKMKAELKSLYFSNLK